MNHRPVTVTVCGETLNRMEQLSASPWRSLKDDPPSSGEYCLARGETSLSHHLDSFTRGGLVYVDRFITEAMHQYLLEHGFTEWMEVPE